MSKFTGLVIATPAYGGQVTSPFLLSMVRTVTLCIQKGISHQVHINAGDSFIPRARALLVAKFLQTDASHFLMIDADMSWQAEDVVKLLLHDKDIVCGAYRQKIPEVRWNFCLEPSAHGETICEVASGLVRISGAGAGFMLVKREAIERMIAAAPETRFVHTGNETPLDAWDLFGPVGTINGTFYGEDIAFCNRWRHLGGEIWLDPSVQLGHHGITAYTADPRSAFSEAPCS